MKKTLGFLLSIILSFSAFCACAVPQKENSSSKNSSAEISESNTSGSDSSGEEVVKTEYKVSLSCKGEKLIPNEPITVAWTGISETGDITSFQTAALDENGDARIRMTNGEYRVTLSNLPDGYTYNPNLYLTTSNNPEITIEMYPIIQSPNSGLVDFYEDVISIRQEGAYRVTIDQRYAVKEGVHFQFHIPKDGGVYSVQSMVDVMQNTINPVAEIYTGSAQFKTWSYTCDGGVEFENGSYTKNFYFEGKATEDQGGFAIIPFKVRATTVDNTFPVTVDFYVSRKADNPSTHKDAELIYAKECPNEKAPEGVGRWVGAETKENGQNVFNSKNYVYNEEDGFYHVGTKDGPYLYVELSTTPNRFLPDYVDMSGTPHPVSFVTIEHIAPVAFLRVAELDHETGERTGRLIHYKPMIEEQYALACNSEGRCLVTEELKWFLQELSESQAYFNDGYGHIEQTLKISALEDDQWLFACGYYKQ